MEYAYVRVSSTDQNIIRQIEEVEKFGIKHRCIFVDKQSGSDFNRPAYQRLVKRLKPKDLVVIKSIDRLGRNYTAIIEEWSRITKQIKADIKVLDMPLLDTREKPDNLIGRFISDIVLQILSFVSENERINIKSRQAEGIRIAMANGIRFGRPRIPKPENFEEIAALYIAFEITLEEAMEQCRLRHTTFYNFLRDFRGNEKARP